MKNELLRRLSVLDKKKVPQINNRSLRGGMQERLHRQQVIGFNNDIDKRKKNIRGKLKSIAAREKEAMLQHELGGSPFNPQPIEPLEDFHEPVMKRMRTHRGFF